MGFLGFGNYNKPGPGISKDEPEKKGFFLFFELYFRKFWKLMEANMLFVVFCIPFFVPTGLVVAFLPNNTIAAYVSMLFYAGIAIMYSGYTYILRNFARQEHAFLWMDFKDTIKKNWKQSLIVGIIDLVVYFVGFVSVSFYANNMSKNSIIIIPFVLSLLFMILFTFMQYYIFVMIITFDLSIKQILKNAAIFSIAGLGRNVLITILLALLVLFNYIWFPASLVLILTIGLSLGGFIINFNVWPVIKKYMIPDDEQVEEDDNQVFDDNLKIKDSNNNK